MIVTDCTSCADERDAGAAFCEVCGQALTAAAGTVAEPGAPETAVDDPVAAPALDAAARPEKDGPGAPARRNCPHCAAERSVPGDGYCEECGMQAGRPRDHIEADGGPVAAAVSDRGRRHHRNEDAMWLAVGADAADVVVSDGVSASFDPDAASGIAARTAGELLSGAPHSPGEAGAPHPSGESSEAGRGTGGTGPDAGGDGAPGVPDGLDLEGDPAPGRSGDLLERTAPAVAIAGVVAAAIAGAAEAVVSLAHTGDPRRAASNPACTIVAAAVRGPHVGFGWVGDSRAYWIGPAGPARQLTEDDSWASHVIALGVDPADAMNDPRAHAITAWLGADAGPVLPRVGAFTAAVPGLLVLCSDGLWNYLPDPADFAGTVRECLAGATGPAPLLAAARALVGFANAAGGADNITVALVPVPAAVDADVDDEAGRAAATA